MSHLLEDHPDWPKNAMTTTTPDNEPLELGEPDSLAGTFTDQIATLKRDLNVAHEELNTQAHELERLLNELAAAQERAEKAEAERDELKRHAEAMASDLEEWIEHGESCGESVESLDRSRNGLAAYRVAFPKDAP